MVRDHAVVALDAARDRIRHDARARGNDAGRRRGVEPVGQGQCARVYVGKCRDEIHGGRAERLDARARRTGRGGDRGGQRDASRIGADSVAVTFAFVWFVVSARVLTDDVTPAGALPATDVAMRNTGAPVTPIWLMGSTWNVTVCVAVCAATVPAPTVRNPRAASLVIIMVRCGDWWKRRYRAEALERSHN